MSEANSRKDVTKTLPVDPEAEIAPDIQIRLLAAFAAIVDLELQARILDFLESLAGR